MLHRQRLRRMSCISPSQAASPRTPHLGSLHTLCPGATLGSFLIALLHFVMELALFQTMSLTFALQPMIVAGAPPPAVPGVQALCAACTQGVQAALQQATGS